MMIDFDVDQTDLANYTGVTPQAINNRLKRLNPERCNELKELIIKVSRSQ